MLAPLNPLTRILLAVGICIAAFISSDFIFLAALLTGSILLGVTGGHAKSTLKLLASLLAICAFLFILQLLFVRTGTPILALITTDGLRIATLVVLRLLCATMPLAIALMATTPTDLCNALVQKLRLPYKYAFTITTALRFIPVFTGEMRAIMEAQTARGLDFDTRNPLRKLRLMAPLCVPLLISSVARTDQAAMAAETRGIYLRSHRHGYKQYPFTIPDALAATATTTLVLTALLL
jgi:energy-coupling factor transport system permease protein